MLGARYLYVKRKLIKESCGWHIIVCNISAIHRVRRPVSQDDNLPLKAITWRSTLTITPLIDRTCSGGVVGRGRNKNGTGETKDRDNG